MSKQIQKLMRREIRKRKTNEILQKLESFSDIKSIPHIKTGRRKKLITQIKNKDGDCITSRQVIADVFAEFYETLYASQAEQDFERSAKVGSVLEFSMQELDSSLKKMKNKKAKDTKGVVAEMLKHSNY